MYAHVESPSFFTSRTSYRLLSILRLRYYSFRARNTSVAYNFDIDCQREYAAQMIITANCNNVAKERLTDFGDSVNTCGPKKKKKDIDKNYVANCKCHYEPKKTHPLRVYELSRFTKHVTNS